LLSFPENVGCCEKNTLQGSISFRDNIYDNMNRQIEADYKYYEITSEKMGNVMTLKYKPSTLNFKRVKLND
jgi:glycosylphosphatidylinositol transamidase (GPIT) subunit GPI8